MTGPTGLQLPGIVQQDGPPVTFADAYDTSTAGPAFSNATDADYWTDAWCGTCTHGQGQDCTLLDVAFVGRTPAQWQEVDRASRTDRYLCTSWNPVAGLVDLNQELECG